MNSPTIWFVIIAIVTFILIVSSYIFSILYNSKVDKDNEEGYHKKRVVSKEMLKREEYIMSVLRRGEIKCHKLPNTAPPYDVEKWVNGMEKFMEKPIFKQIMELKGYDINEKHKG